METTDSEEPKLESKEKFLVLIAGTTAAFIARKYTEDIVTKLIVSRRPKLTDI